MTYDWDHGRDGARPLSWFDEQDRLSIKAHRHFATMPRPFADLIPYDRLDGAEVLEIGSGSGFHAELMARAGAKVTGLDITEAAVGASTRRFELKGLEGTFEQRDAEHDHPPFGARFDFVWSWGVIHHSSHTARIVRNVHNWLKPDGAFSGMVYHRDSTVLPVGLIRDWIVHRNLGAHGVDEALWRNSDGFTARFYPADQWRDLLLAFFEQASVGVNGADEDFLPLPRRIRDPILQRVSDQTKDRFLRRAGHFLLFSASSPSRSA